MMNSLEIGQCIKYIYIYKRVKCSALTGLGLNEGMEWLANTMKKWFFFYFIILFFKI